MFRPRLLGLCIVVATLAACVLVPVPAEWWGAAGPLVLVGVGMLLGGGGVLCAWPRQ